MSGDVKVSRGGRSRCAENKHTDRGTYLRALLSLATHHLLARGGGRRV